MRRGNENLALNLIFSPKYYKKLIRYKTKQFIDYNVTLKNKHLAS